MPDINAYDCEFCRPIEGSVGTLRYLCAIKSTLCVSGENCLEYRNESTNPRYDTVSNGVMRFRGKNGLVVADVNIGRGNEFLNIDLYSNGIESHFIRWTSKHHRSIRALRDACNKALGVINDNQSQR